VNLSLLNVVAKDRSTLIKQLLNQGINVNVTNKYGQTPLRLYFKRDDFKPEMCNIILRMLITIGLDINETYEKTSLLCLQVLEAKACVTFQDYIKRQLCIKSCLRSIQRVS